MKGKSFEEMWKDILREVRKRECVETLSHRVRNEILEVSERGIVVRSEMTLNSRYLSKERYPDLDSHPPRKRAVLEQRKDYDGWKKRVEFTMRCVGESIFSANRRFGADFFSIKESFRKVERRLRTILLKVLIHPR